MPHANRLRQAGLATAGAQAHGNLLTWAGKSQAHGVESPAAADRSLPAAAVFRSVQPLSVNEFCPEETMRNDFLSMTVIAAILYSASPQAAQDAPAIGSNPILKSENLADPHMIRGGRGN